MTLSEAMEAHREAFDETFPLIAVMDCTDDEIVQKIRACIEDGRPYILMGGVEY
jgi:hypothetical protein